MKAGLTYNRVSSEPGAAKHDDAGKTYDLAAPEVKNQLSFSLSKLIAGMVPEKIGGNSVAPNTPTPFWPSLDSGIIIRSPVPLVSEERTLIPIP